LNYNIYANNGAGGPIDYTTPIGSTTDLSFVIGPLAPLSDNRFAVRALDPATNLEEANTESCVRILLDANGSDISSRPNPPHALVIRSIAGGGCRASWAYNPIGQGGTPIGFHVYLTQGNTPAYDSPSASVAYLAGTMGYSCVLSGLAAGTSYTVAVRAYNGTAIENNTTVVATLQTSLATSNPVDSLVAVTNSH
jgi:hypothetical protein